MASVMEINRSLPATSVDELITYAKASPGNISFASTGNGTTGHMSGELFKMMTGAGMVHLPYHKRASRTCRPDRRSSAGDV